MSNENISKSEWFIKNWCDEALIEDSIEGMRVDMKDLIDSEVKKALKKQNKEGSFETGVRETVNGHQAWFSIGHQAFGLQEREKEEEMTSEEYAKWYEGNLKTALNRLLNKEQPKEVKPNSYGGNWG